MRSPIKYYGGKHWLAKVIVPLIPSHTTYIEPFFGGGNVFFCKRPSPMEIINDLADNIYALFKTISDKDALQRLQERLELTPYHEKIREEYKELLKQSEDGTGKSMTDEDRAYYYLYVSRSSFNGVGGFSVTRTLRHGMIRPVYDYLSMINHLSDVHTRLRNAVVMHRDALDIIGKDTYGQDTFMYLDPPYVTETRKSNQKYIVEMTDDDHRRMLDLCIASKAKICISGYDHPIYDVLEENGWQKMSMKTINAKYDAIETVWINYPIEYRGNDLSEIERYPYKGLEVCLEK